MNNTFINLRHEYYEYEWEGLEKRGLAIGGHKSEFLAYLVAS